MKLSLKPSRFHPGRLVLGFPLLYRAVFGTIGLFLLAGLVLSGGQTGVPDLPAYAVILICFATALYEESWTFDKENNRAVERTGLLAVNAKKTYAISSIHSFRLTLVSRSGIGKNVFNLPCTYWASLHLILNDGGEQILEIQRTRSLDGVRKKAQDIAAYCGKELVVEDR